VLAIGDSVMATARSALNDAAGGHVIIDAVVGRQVDDGLNVLQRHRDAGELAGVSAVVIHLGTNGPMTTRHFERLAQLVEGVPNVVVVNVRVPRRWEAQSNTSIGEGVPHHAAMQLADWYRASEPRGVLANDGVHPTPSGAKVYARLIVDLVHHREPAAPSTTTMPAPEPPPSTEPPPPTQPEPTTTTEPAPTSTTIPG
jgi:lysophospholipase L1-like esterase